MRRIAPLAGILCCLMRAAPAAADPSVDYMLHCRGCHGPDGEGIDGGAPAFRGQLGRFLSVPDGRAYLVRTFDPDGVPHDFAPYAADEVARYRALPLSEVAATRDGLLRAAEARARAAQ
jgi:hypothetical protein